MELRLRLGECRQWPGAGRLWASRDGVLLPAWTAVELDREINRKEQVTR
jgi:hypothetical protein